jgi:hypothetical protein
MICHICGVKVTATSVRRERFGHIDLGIEIASPFADYSESLSTFPVLPAAFHASPAGEKLMQLYDELIETRNSEKCKGPLSKLVDFLLPVLQVAHAWALADEEILAKSLALKRRQARVENSLTLVPD